MALNLFIGGIGTMNFTAKEDYGLRAVVDIGLHRESAPIQAKEIANRQSIPEQFLEQLLATLRRAGIVRSIRGASGGYDLARHPAQITVGEILTALSGPLVPIQCVNDHEAGTCSRQELCSVSMLWCRIKAAIVEVVSSTTVQDLMEQQRRLEAVESYMMHI